MRLNRPLVDDQGRYPSEKNEGAHPHLVVLSSRPTQEGDMVNFA